MIGARTAARVAWSLTAISVVSVIVGVWLLWSSGSTADPGHSGKPLMDLDFVAFAAIGALIVSRQPGNAIGWLFCVLGAATALGGNGLGYGYVHYGLFGHPGALPAGEWVAWVANWVNAAGLASAPLLLLLFPTGRVPSPGWGPVAWLTLIDAAINGIAAALQPGPLDTFPSALNPAGLQGLPGQVARGVGGVAFPATAALLVVGAASVVWRFRHAGTIERQQIKWFAFDAAIVAFVFAVLFDASALDPDLASPPFPQIVDFLWALALAGPPISVGVAILRYRLYDIDLIIRRTLIYGALTASLGAVYFGAVILLQQLFRALAGQTSDLAIVGSTLAIAAHFQPLRRRIQSAVDRRFYRRRYDATRVLSVVSAAIRDEVDLDRLTDQLLRVVEDTM